MGIKTLDIVKMCSDRKIKPECMERLNVFCFRVDRVAAELNTSAVSAEYIDERDGVVVEIEIDDLEISGRLRGLFELLVLSTDSIGFKYVDEDVFVISLYKDDIYEE